MKGITLYINQKDGTFNGKEDRKWTSIFKFIGHGIDDGRYK